MTSALAPYSNRILLRLPPAELDLLKPDLERIAVRPRDILQEPGEPADRVYFPEAGMVSLVIPLSDGRAVEVAAIGWEGIVGHWLTTDGLPSPLQALGQVGGEGISIPRAAFLKALPSCPQLSGEVAVFGQLMLAVASQNVACGQLHQLGERLSRWLLTVKDLTRSSSFSLTQEFMAEMLGTNRPTVTLGALALSNSGLIRYSRGRIEIVDIEGLEDSACECYQTLRREYDRLAVG